MAASKGIAPVQARPEDQGSKLAEIVPAPIRAVSQHARLERIQDDLLERSLAVVDGSVSFADIEPGALEPPPEWIEQYGHEGAMRRLRVARASWMNAKEAPVGIKVAAQVAVGILRAKAQEKSGPKTLNIAVVQMTAPLPQFEEREIEPGR